MIKRIRDPCKAKAGPGENRLSEIRVDHQSCQSRSVLPDKVSYRFRITRLNCQAFVGLSATAVNPHPYLEINGSQFPRRIENSVIFIQA